MSILGTIALAAVGTLVPGAGIAIAIYKFGKDEVLGGLKKAASWLFLHPMALVAIAALVFGLIERGNARHWQKVDEGHVATIAEDVKAMKTMTASLTGALSRINDNNRRIAAAATELERERQEAAAADARSNARYVPTGAAVGRLEASAATKGLPPCKVSQEAAHALEGL